MKTIEISEGFLSNLKEILDFADDAVTELRGEHSYPGNEKYMEYLNMIGFCCDHLRVCLPVLESGNEKYMEYLNMIGFCCDHLRVCLPVLELGEDRK